MVFGLVCSLLSIAIAYLPEEEVIFPASASFAKTLVPGGGASVSKRRPESIRFT